MGGSISRDVGGGEILHTFTFLPGDLPDLETQQSDK
jgi:hypothetical protein